MLLEVTPSLLHSLGIRENSIVSYGSASFASPKGGQVRTRRLKVIRLKKSVPTRTAVTDQPLQTAAADPGAEMLSAEAMAQRMQCTRANVYDLERRGKLLSVVPPGRQNGREFPAFQLDPMLDRELLWELIAVYAQREVPMNLLWNFVRSVHAEFGGLTGVQVLTRKTSGHQIQEARARAIAELPEAQRREFVKDVALEDLTHAFT